MASVYPSVIDLSANGINLSGLSIEEDESKVQARIKAKGTKLFTFPSGDMNAKVSYKGEEIMARVNTGVMVYASEVWKRFTYPPWTVGDQTQDKQIGCSEDNADALLILLNIVHMQLNKVPKRLVGDKGITTLYHIARQCEEYALHHLVGIWCKGWLESLRYLEVARSVEVQRSEWLYIFWALGETEAFRALSFGWWLRSRTISSMDVVFEEDPDTVECLEQITQHTLKMRWRWFAQIFSAVKWSVEEVSEEKHSCRHGCQRKTQEDYLTLVKKFRGTFESPPTECAEWMIDLRNLAFQDTTSALGGNDNSGNEERNIYGMPSHVPCFCHVTPKATYPTWFFYDSTYTYGNYPIHFTYEGHMQRCKEKIYGHGARDDLEDKEDDEDATANSDNDNDNED